MPFMLCADFSIFPDDLQLGPSFTLAAMDFQDAVGSGTASFVNETLGERGLQFPDAGIEIDLPVPVSWARLRIGQFASAYTVEGISSTGTVVATINTNFPNSYRNVRVRAPDLSAIRFAGGDNEGSIVSACILV